MDTLSSLIDMVEIFVQQYGIGIALIAGCCWLYMEFPWPNIDIALSRDALTDKNHSRVHVIDKHGVVQQFSVMVSKPSMLYLPTHATQKKIYQQLEKMGFSVISLELMNGVNRFVYYPSSYRPVLVEPLR